MNTKELFEKKGFEPKAIEYLNDFLYEFNELCGEFLSQEEVIERINDYLDEIEFVDEIQSHETKDVLGCYNSVKRKVSIKISDRETEKSVFFHEMIHVLRQKIEEILIKKIEAEIFEDESQSMYLSGTGVDEGFTEYLTSKRDEKFSKSKTHNSYPILKEQFGILIDIVGEDLISGMFNSHEQVESILQEKMTWEPDDCNDYCVAMNVVYKYEREVFIEKIMANGKKSTEEQLFEKIFGFQNSKKTRIPTDVNDAIDIIVKKYLMQSVNTVEDFYSLMDNMQNYAKSLGKTVGEEMIMILYQQYKNHPEFNLDESNPELCKSFKIYEKLQEFYNLDFEEKLQILTEDKEFLELIGDNENSYAFKKMLVQHMYKGDEEERVGLDRFVRDDHQLSDYCAVYNMLITGVLKEKFQAGEVKLDTLALEWIEADDYYGEFSVFNLFNVDGKKEKYLGTYSIGGSYCLEILQYEVAKLPMEERKKLVSRIYQDVYESEMTDQDVEKYLFLCDSKSKQIKLACSTENQWINIEDDVDAISDKAEYISSITEENIKNNAKFIDMGLEVLFFNTLQDMGVIPNSVVDEYIEKLDKQYLTPDDIMIEIDRQNVSIGDIKQMVQDFIKRLDEKKQGKSLLITGGEDIEK